MTRSARLPRLALVSWVVAAAVVVILVVAVARHLSASSGGMHDHGAVESLYRAGSAPMHPLSGSRVFTAWQLDAVAVAVLVLLAAWYVTGVALRRIRRPGSRWPLHRTVAFFAGLAVCAIATNGSIAVYDQVLFSAHMLGHLALVMAAPALIMVGRPLRLAIESAPPRRAARLQSIATGRVVSLLTAPPVALACYAAVIVGSHLTGVMDHVMRVTWAGQLEHLVYLVAGCQFFILVVGDEPIRWRLASPARWLLLAIAMAVDTFTGIVLMQGTRAVAMLPAPGVHVSALSDTRTGGAIMWFGGDAIMALVMVVLVVGWLRQVDERAADDPSWLEQARRSTLAAQTGTADAGADVDADDAARESYNEWLARLERGS